MAALESSTCPECRKVFTPLTARQRFCSKNCFLKGQRPGHSATQEKPQSITRDDATQHSTPQPHREQERPLEIRKSHQTMKKLGALEIGKEPEVLRDSLGRKRYLHKYQFGKPDEPITKEQLEEALKNGHFVHPLSHKSYLVITALIGSRKTEALEIFKEDIHQEGNSLFVKIPAKKHGERGGKLELPLSWLGMDLVIEQWQRTRKGRKVWPFTPWTAWKIIKRIWPEKSPHHLRWTVVTELRALKDARQITIDEIKSWTGIKRDSTIEGYGLKTQAGIHKISEIRSSARTGQP